MFLDRIGSSHREDWDRSLAKRAGIREELWQWAGPVWSAWPWLLPYCLGSRAAPFSGNILLVRGMQKEVLGLFVGHDDLKGYVLGEVLAMMLHMGLHLPL